MQKTRTRTGQINVLLLTGNKESCAPILSLLADKKLTFSVLPLERFFEMEDRLSELSSSMQRVFQPTSGLNASE
jgi:hypothetical protein